MNAAEMHNVPVFAAWQTPAFLGVCETCDGLFLLPGQPDFAAGEAPRCPFCCAGKLSPIEHQSEAMQTLADVLRPAEFVLPFRLPPERLTQQLVHFATGIPLAPDDLSAEKLRARLRRVYLPVWLVDSKVQATWQAEAGFNYQVVSHQEAYRDGGGWSTRSVNETRQRWEPRLGRLERTYQNLSAPALEAHKLLFKRLGKYASEQAVPYSPTAAFSQLPETAMAGIYAVHLPDRCQSDAWPDILPRFQAAATEEVKQACSADHVRDFRWSPQFEAQNWTLMLLPAYTTFYLDDENRSQRVLLNGQTGQLDGVRRASPRRARNIALTILMVAMLTFLLSVCVSVVAAFAPPLLAVAAVGLVLSLLIAAGAIIPWVIVWYTNRQEG